MHQGAKNVLGSALQTCCLDPATGFYRDGHCRTGPGDVGTHVICARMTEAFLRFSRSRGNDLSAPKPEVDFPGLLPGDKWCLCALRWKEALQAGCAPPVFLESCDETALQHVPLEALRAHAVKAETIH